MTHIFTLCNYLVPIKINGGWTEWSEWTSCSKSCGKGTQSRFRNCTNPSPQNGGNNCDGDTEKQGYCNTQKCQGKDIIWQTKVNILQMSKLSYSMRINRLLFGVCHFRECFSLFLKPEPGLFTKNLS